MKDLDDVMNDVKAYKRAAIRVAKARGRGRAASYLRTTSNPSLAGLARYARRGGSDLDRFGEQVARRMSSPWITVEELVDTILRSRGRLLRTLERARGRAHTEQPSGLDVEALNEERFADPESALESSFAALRKAGGRAEVARVLAVHASNLREHDRLDDALLAIWIAMPLAEAAEIEDQERLALIGWLLQGAACVMRARGDRDPALSLIDEAEAVYCRAQSRRGRTLAKLDRAGLLVGLYGDHRSAIAEASAALAIASPDALRLVCVAYHVRAVAHHLAGDLDKAAADIAVAASRVPGGASMLLGRVRWLHGAIAADQGNLIEAESLLEEAYRLIPEPACDRLMIAAQMIEAAARRGDNKRATAIAMEHLPSLAEPIHKDQQVLEAAFSDLYRAAMKARVSANEIEAIVATVAAARKRTTRR